MIGNMEMIELSLDQCALVSGGYASISAGDNGLGAGDGYTYTGSSGPATSAQIEAYKKEQAWLAAHPGMTEADYPHPWQGAIP
ncbi:hypothetical protein FBZ88_10923 [Nitrospirillum bahiense]|uniref:Uncharacterized protein n=2 Tax=Nitrospirillum amazonense TaxID=28077 RepID=A0A560FVF9_9PROT|nr:hypothetical protein FBZ88_10923 [Nitrospirillum amazonense]